MLLQQKNTRRGLDDPVLTIGMPGGDWRLRGCWCGGSSQDGCVWSEVATTVCDGGVQEEEEGKRAGGLQKTLHDRTGGGNGNYCKGDDDGGTCGLVYRYLPLLSTQTRSRSSNSSSQQPRPRRPKLACRCASPAAKLSEQATTLATDRTLLRGQHV